MTTTQQAARKCYSANEENFNYESLGELIDDHGLDIGSIYWEADAIEISSSDFIYVDNILEAMDEVIYEEVGEVYGNECSDVSSEAKAELDTLITEWARKHITLRYWKVRNSKECKVVVEDLK